EASSHGLDQGRLDGLLFDQAGFTNLSRDHLDYHPTMEAYWHAKRRLFAQRLRPGGLAVIDERAPQTDEL
ncbi:MAG: Mur ligase family protein, partial [Alphaproteobacteria bacterium]